MGENQSPQIITTEEMRGARVLVDPSTTADIWRQQAGVEVKVNGESLATNLDSGEVEGLDHELGAWLTEKQMEQAKLSKVEIDQTQELVTSMGLVSLDKKLRQAIQGFLEQDPSGERQSLQELFGLGAMDRRSIPYTIKLTLAKVNTLLEINGLDQALINQLKQIRDFYEQDLVPELKLSDEENQNLEIEIGAYLRQPRSTIEESYIDKAKRALLGQKGGWGQRFIGGVAKADAESLPINLWEQTLTLATTVNHVRLLEGLERPMTRIGSMRQLSRNIEFDLEPWTGIDLAEIKGNISNIMMELSSVKETPDIETLLVTNGLWNRLATEISKVTNLIAKKFPHDTVYLLGQALERGEAVCAGKAMMAAMVLRDLGLEAVYTRAIIRVDSDHDGQHAYTHVRLPGGIRLALDLNYWKGVELSQFKHLSGWLVPTGEVVTENNLAEQIILAAPSNKKTLLRTRGGFKVFEHSGGQHRLVSENEQNQPEFEVFNLARLLEDNPQLFAAELGKSSKAVLKEAYRLYGEAIRINPRNDAANCGLADLLEDNPQLFAAELGKSSEAVLKEAYRLYREAIRINPRNDAANNNLAILLEDNPQLFAAELGKSSKAVLKEAYRLYGEAIRINPNSSHYYNRGLFAYTHFDRKKFDQLGWGVSYKDFLGQGIADLHRFKELILREDPGNQEITEADRMIGVMQSLQSRSSVVTFLKSLMSIHRPKTGG